MSWSDGDPNWRKNFRFFYGSQGMYRVIRLCSFRLESRDLEFWGAGRLSCRLEVHPKSEPRLRVTLFGSHRPPKCWRTGRLSWPFRRFLDTKALKRQRFSPKSTRRISSKCSEHIIPWRRWRLISSPNCFFLVNDDLVPSMDLAVLSVWIVDGKWLVSIWV